MHFLIRLTQEIISCREQVIVPNLNFQYRIKLSFCFVNVINLSLKFEQRMELFHRRIVLRERLPGYHCILWPVEVNSVLVAEIFSRFISSCGGASAVLVEAWSLSVSFVCGAPPTKCLATPDYEKNPGPATGS